ncbi:Ig-like domain-containing protein [Paenibacillus sp. YN15]|uniref:Ig-like domain-containing protein n=1 Tax=Paenibacillus sp. YN15 TaxID=1742774 RepID=UPI000DCAFEB4|nr:Ig-like domain-containing protein [Paenibacillus sp. YN15]RAV01488.1 hypothetical protein DQG13_12350 [Paenibacillus sp. YN15]
MYPKRLLLVLLAGLLLLSSPGFALGAVATTQEQAPGQIFYVATDGNDSNPGTLNAPFLTLEKARDTIRQLKAADGLPEGGVTVYLRGGLYERSQSFELREEDSGVAGKIIKYQAYPGETVRLSGGADLQKSWFTPVADQNVLSRIIDPEARTKVLEVNLAAHGLSDYGELSRHGYYLANDLSKVPPMELYVDGQGMTLARWPNQSTVKMDEVLDPGPTRREPTEVHTRGGTFSYAYDRPQYWSQADDIWLDGIFGYSWEWSYNKIASIDTANKTITLRYGEMSGIFNDNWYPDFHFAQNLLEEIDMPGEYYIDRQAGMLYFLPNASFERGNPEITVTVLKTPMINALNASYITFEDMVLENGRDSAAVFMGGTHMLLNHCEIRNFTNSGVLLNTQSRFYYNDFSGAPGSYNGVSNSHIHHIGGTAVTVTGGNKTTLEPGNNFVENSHIHDFAYYHKAYNPGVHLSGAGNRMSHNELHDAPHPGILIFGNDHLVEYNDIYDVCKTFSDLGAIYMNLGASPQERGTVIRRNYFHNIGESKAGVEGVYPDNFTMGITIEENIFNKMGNSAIKNNGGSHILTRNNIFIDSKVPYDYADLYLGDKPENQIPKNYMPQWQALFAANNNYVGTPHMAKYPELADFFTENRYYPTTNTFTNNVIYNPTKTRSSTTNDNGAYDKFNLVQYSGNWIAESDPGFADLAGGNLELKADAEVFTRIPGFAAIPFADIGVIGKAGTLYGPDHFPVQEVYVYNKNITLGIFKTASIQAEVLPWNATNSKLAYQSDRPDVAAVDSKGVITGVSMGQAVITVTSQENPLLVETVQVTVDEGDGIMDFADFELGSGDWVLDGNRAIDKIGDNRWYRIKSGATSLSKKDFSEYELNFRLLTPDTIPAYATLYIFDRQVGADSSRIGYKTNADGTSRWLLYNAAWGTVKEVTFPDHDLKPNTEYRIKALVKGADISVYVNDQLRLKANDPTHNLTGKVGFYVNNFSYLWFDDIKFTLPTTAVSGLLLDKTQANMTVGETLTLHASFDPSDAANTAVNWSSSNPQVATVDGNGVVTGVSMGEAVITAVSVENPNAAASAKVIISNVMHTTDFESGGNGWPVDPNRSIVTIDGNRWYKILNGASGVVNKEFSGYDLTFKLKTPPTLPDATTFYIFDRQNATGGPSRIGYRTTGDGTSKWLLYNAAWATVKQNVLPAPDLQPDTEYQFRVLADGADIKVYVNGQLKLEASDPGHQASGKVGFYAGGFSYLLFDDIVFKQLPVAVTGIELLPGQSELQVGQTATLAATVLPVNASDRELVWATSDPTVATVDDNGAVSGLAVGEAVITVKSAASPEVQATHRVKVVHKPDPAKAPGKPVLSDNNGHDTGLLDGSYSIRMDMWWGNNGSIYKLYENGMLIDTKQLEERTPGAQSTVTAVTYKPNGVYVYEAELINDFGTTRSDPYQVTVAQAVPGQPVLAHNNWDGDGSFQVQMNMWWGTNASLFRLYENGSLIAEQPLQSNTPSAQQAVVELQDRSPGRYEYVAELVNGAGTTTSQPLTVEVKNN